jgi:hypothetical protein
MQIETNKDTARCSKMMEIFFREAGKTINLYRAKSGTCKMMEHFKNMIVL